MWPVDRSHVHESFLTTLSITAMIMLIAAAAFYLNFVLGMMGVLDMLTKFVIGMKASLGQIILILTVLYLILGCFLDALAMVVGTIPIVFPIVVALGIDPVWFGIFLVIMAELALITPPVGHGSLCGAGGARRGQYSGRDHGRAAVPDRHVAACRHSLVLPVNSVVVAGADA